jgi:hypothetical protein
VATTELRARAQQPRQRDRQNGPLSSLSEAARELLKDSPRVASPTHSRTGIRGRTNRVRSVLRTTMKKNRS